MPKKLLALLLFGILFTTTFSSSYAQTKTYDVIVIGAGMAGLAAADHLDEKGYSVLVLEARDRLGGRIWTNDSWGIPIDLGASWIHGIDGNPIWKLVQEYNIKTVKTDEDSYIIYPDEYSELAEDSELYDNFLEVSLEEFKQLNPDASFQDAIDYFLARHTLSPEENVVFRSTVYGEVELDFAADAPDLALEHNVAYRIDGQEDNDVVFPDGYVQVIEKLADGLEIKTEHIVEKIDYTDKSTVLVTTNQGTFSAKRVISTLPNGVLQSGSVTFSPELPEEKITAINNLKMGLMNKNFFLFDKVFWDEDVDWIVRVGDDYNKWAFFFNFAKYLDEPILMGFSTGEYARELEKLPDEEIIQSAMDALETIYPGEVTEPTKYHITRWASDEFAGGSYAYIHVGASIDDYDTMREPVNDQIFFAGEATDIYPQTVHGAYFSGMREAIKIHMSDYGLLSPLQQVNEGLHPYYVECKEGLTLIIRTESTRAACVTSDTAAELIARELAQSPEDYLESILF